MKRLQQIILSCGAVFFATATANAGEIFTFNQDGSTIAFQVRHLLGTAKGQFHRFSGTIDLNRDQPERSSVSARVEAASIDTGIRKRDAHLRSAEFFNVAKFSEITFKSRAVKQTGEQSGDVTGDLTMHGIARPIVLHVQLLGGASGQRSRWKVTTAALKRREFGLVFSGPTETVSGIGQDVSVQIEIEASRFSP